MSILKKKIKIKALEDIDRDEKLQVKIEDSTVQKQIHKAKPKLANTQKNQDAKGGFNSVRGTKIVRNYAKALCSFAYSDLALSYLQEIMKEQYNDTVEAEGFRRYIKEKKRNTASISSLRDLLLESDNDSENEKKYKQIFAEISIIFIKFFSVNWIFSGKMKYRLEHVKYRHRMLRRIRNPEFFTYLKSSGGES